MPGGLHKNQRTTEGPTPGRTRGTDRSELGGDQGDAEKPRGEGNSREFVHL